MDASLRVEHFGLMAGLSLVVLAGCGGSALQPIAARDIVATRSAWMASDAKAHDLLYVADTMYTGRVIVYSYPEGKLKGQITGVKPGQGLCSDRQGNVFIPAGSSILEYAHGGSEPINVLNDQYGGAQFCSVDPKTGNLAVSPTVAVYAHAQGNPTAYPGGLALGNFSCTYDDKGNLFVNGYLEPNTEKMGLGAAQRAHVIHQYSLSVRDTVRYDSVGRQVLDTGGHLSNVFRKISDRRKFSSNGRLLDTL